MIPEDEVAQALDEIRTRQRQVVGASVVPAWFWSAVAVLMVEFSIGIESHRRVLMAWGTSIYVIGLLAVILTVVLRSRAQIRPRYLGRAGAATIAGFVVAVLAVALAVGFGLAATGFRWPATAGVTVAAVCVAAGGPLLMRRLRTVMTRRVYP
jgi:hydrogenase-4 membrane subunit HyfE